MKPARVLCLLATSAWFAACGGTPTPADLSPNDDLSTSADMAAPSGDMTAPPGDMATPAGDMAMVGPKLSGVNCQMATVTAEMLFDQLVKNTMKGCADCHVGRMQGMLDLGSADKLRALKGAASTGSSMKMVTADDPDQSYLLYKIYGQQAAPGVGGRGMNMPLRRPELSNADKCLFVNWVRSGAR